MFGAEFRKKYFTSLDPEVVTINHGSFGLTPDPVLRAYREAMNEDFSYPEKFLRIDLFTEYTKALKVLGKFVHADYRNLAIVPNATHGVNTVLRSLSFVPGDKVVLLANTIYGAVGNTAEFLHEKNGVEIIKLHVEYPVSDDDVLAAFEKTFQEEKPKVAIFDAISSMPGVRFPFERLTELCHKYGVLSVVDGAHCIGILPLDFQTFKPDFFVTNLHKWLFVPRGSALLYVDKKHFRTIQTMPVSHSFVSESKTLTAEEESNLLVRKFEFTGTGNFAQIVAIESALKFREEECGGEKKIWDYCHGLAVEVGERLSKKWNTSVLENEARSLTTPMVNVELPYFGMTVQQYKDNEAEIQSQVYNKMIVRDKTFVPVVVVNNKVYCRLSGQVYNEYSDYEFATDVLLRYLRAYKIKSNL